MGIVSLLNDPREFLLGLLISLPGMLLALSGHEAAHAYVANRCGDPTARLLGRVTLNPAKHIDPVGFLCMFLVGIGWAKPVPVNPINYRHYRRDDLLVSLAGITANLIMCLLGFLIMMCTVLFALSRVPQYSSLVGAYASDETLMRFPYGDAHLLYGKIGNDTFWLSMDEVFTASSGIWQFGTANGAYVGINDILITPVLGTFAGYAYQMLTRFVMVNLVLACFNLIPVPPLDGYHVLNDIVLKRPLFAQQNAMRIGQGILFALIMLGNFNEDFNIINKALSFVQQNAMDGLTSLAYAALNALGYF